MVNYEIVHIFPDKTQAVIATVRDKEHLVLIVETPKYLGTWLDDNRKLLRYGKGTILIREIYTQPRIITHKAITNSYGKPEFELFVKDHDVIATITVDNRWITGYDIHKDIKWRTESFTRLSELLSKDLAYQVYRYHEKFCTEMGMESAI